MEDAAVKREFECDKKLSEIRKEGDQVKYNSLYCQTPSISQRAENVKSKQALSEPRSNLLDSVTDLILL